MKISENFCLQEFVPPEIYTKFGNSSIWFIDNRLINVVQYIRTATKKPLTINNWHKGGTYKESGYRVPDSTTGAKYSQHKFGRAADLKSELTPQEIYLFIKDSWKVLSSLGLTTVENVEATKTWLHIDLRHSDKRELLIVNPIKKPIP